MPKWGTAVSNGIAYIVIHYNRLIEIIKRVGGDVRPIYMSLFSFLWCLITSLRPRFVTPQVIAPST